MKFVRHHNTRRAPTVQKLEQKPLGGRLLSSGLDKNVANIIFRIGCVPQTMRLVIEPDGNLVEMPFVGLRIPITPGLDGKPVAGALRPIEDCLIGNRKATFYQKIFHIAQAQNNSVVGINRVSDNALRKPEAFDLLQHLQCSRWRRTIRTRLRQQLDKAATIFGAQMPRAVWAVEHCDTNQHFSNLRIKVCYHQRYAKKFDVIHLSLDTASAAIPTPSLLQSRPHKR